MLSFWASPLPPPFSQAARRIFVAVRVISFVVRIVSSKRAKCPSTPIASPGNQEACVAGGACGGGEIGTDLPGYVRVVPRITERGIHVPVLAYRVDGVGGHVRPPAQTGNSHAPLPRL